MRRTWLLSLVAAAFLGSLLSVTACQSAPPPAAAAQPPYEPTATIQDLMLGVIDGAADEVWLSVTTVQSAEGTVETAPQNDEDWTKVRHGAITLAEGANLLMMPGRRVAAPGVKSVTPGIELEPEEMDALIAKDRAAWDRHALQLHEAAVAVLKAADAKDAQKVFELGEQIELACEGCHKAYWYPNEVIPELPKDLE
jgi:hypothetical protein